MILAGTETYEKNPDVAWRHAAGHIYLLNQDRSSIYKTDGPRIVSVSQDEVKSVFGPSAQAVIRISNQI